MPGRFWGNPPAFFSVYGMMISVGCALYRTLPVTPNDHYFDSGPLFPLSIKREDSERLVKVLNLCDRYTGIFRTWEGINLEIS